MTSRSNILLLVFLSTARAFTVESDPTALVRQWLPMNIGDRWIYEEEILSGNRHHPDVVRWKLEETTVSIESIPQGLFVKRKVTVLDTAPPSSIRIKPESNILIRQNCVFYLNDAYPSNDRLPDLCLPLRTGKTWGDPHKGRDLWTVAGFGRKNSGDPASVMPDSWRLEANLSSGDDNYVWFQKGLGITGKRTYHNGTYDDQRVHLLRFQPGSKN